MKKDIYKEEVVKEALMEYVKFSKNAYAYYASEVSEFERNAMRLEILYMEHIAQNPRRFLHPNRLMFYPTGSTDAWNATVNDDILNQGGYSLIPYKKITDARSDKVVVYRGIKFASLAPDDWARVGFDFLCRLIIDFYRDNDYASVRRLMDCCNFIVCNTDKNPNVALNHEDIEREIIRSVMPRISKQRQAVLKKFYEKRSYTVR